MAKLPFMPLYVADYQADTRCLSLATRGAWMDMLCVLWKSPTRGKRSLSLEGWAGEIGKPHAEVSAALAELDRCGVGKISYQTLEEHYTIIRVESGRMLRDEAQRKRKANNKNNQRVREMSPGMSPSQSPRCHRNVTAMSPGDSIFHTSYSISHTKKEREERKKEKTVGEGRALARPPKSEACWLAYRQAYAEVWKVEPVRNSRVNADLCHLVDRLGADVAPLVAGFYPTHQRPLYVTARHPTNLLVRDAEALRTDFLTGQTTATEPPVARSVVELIR
jgi:uncharacterized protein YdaU (DUF1376 family)